MRTNQKTGKASMAALAVTAGLCWACGAAGLAAGQSQPATASQPAATPPATSQTASQPATTEECWDLLARADLKRRPGEPAQALGQRRRSLTDAMAGRPLCLAGKVAGVYPAPWGSLVVLAVESPGRTAGALQVFGDTADPAAPSLQVGDRIEATGVCHTLSPRGADLIVRVKQFTWRKVP